MTPVLSLNTIAKSYGSVQALKIALGEMSIEVLKSATVSSEKLEATGFQFMFNDIETAIYNLNKMKSR